MTPNQPNIPQELESVTDWQLRVEDCRRDNESVAQLRIADATICGGDFSELGFEQVVFENCRFMDCSFARGSFVDVQFKSCDLSNNDFSKSYFCRCEFQAIKGVGTNFNNSKFKDIVFNNCNCNYAAFDSVRIERFLIDRSSFNESFFTSAFVRSVELRDSRLIGASFFRTPLKDIDFTSCILSNITVSDDKSELRGAIVTLDQAAELAKLLGVVIR